MDINLTVAASVPVIIDTLPARFLNNVVYHPATGCWNWIGVTKKGQLLFNCFGRSMRALVISWELFKGYLPKHQRLVRTCGNTRCVCPWHISSKTEQIRKRRLARRGGGRILTIDQILEIRHAPGKRKHIARQFDISEWHVWAIRNGHCNAHVVSPLVVEPTDDKRKREAQEFVERNLALLEDIRKRART
jgi:hypothetical protein